MDEDYSRSFVSQLPDPASPEFVVEPLADSAPPAAPRTTAPTATRLVLGIVLGLAVSALGGLILGEYPFTGLLPYIAGVLFALVITEVILSIGHRPGVVTAAAGALCTAGGLGMGIWISVGEGVAPVPIGGWIAVVVGIVVALLRGGIIRAARGSGDQPAPP